MADFVYSRAYPEVRLLSVKAYINTQRAGHPFLVDPGQPRTAVIPRLVRQYGLEDSAEIFEHLDVYPTPYNGHDGGQADVAFETNASARENLPVEGVLGMNWFQRYTRLTLHMTTDDDGPFIELTL